MDTRNGNLYNSRAAALDAGVPASAIEQIDVVTIQTGPFKGRSYVKHADGTLGRRVYPQTTTVRPGYVGDTYAPAGTVVQEGAVAGYTKLVGAGSIYTITPCDEAAAITALEAAQHRPLMAVRVPAAGALPPAPTIVTGPDLDDEDDDGDVCENCGDLGEDVVLRAGADVPLCDDCWAELAKESR